MISDHQEDDAALSALGLLDDDERARFARELAADTDLRALTRELREAAASLALAAGPRTLPPPAELKARLLARVAGENPGAPPPNTKAVSGPWMNWLRWPLAAACLAAGFLLARGYADLQRQLQVAHGFVRQQSWTIRQLSAALEQADSPRQPAVPLTQAAVYQLEPVPAGPAQPHATVVWDAARREGKLSVIQLKPPKEGHDYQLWVIEQGCPDPVSAGLVRVDAEGRASVDFKPAGPSTAKVNAFALSLEPAGGSAKNQGPILLLGKP